MNPSTIGFRKISSRSDLIHAPNQRKGPGRLKIRNGAQRGATLRHPAVLLFRFASSHPLPHLFHSGPGTQEGDLTLRIESGDKRVRSGSWNNLLYISVGSDPFQLIERGEMVNVRLSAVAIFLTDETKSGFAQFLSFDLKTINP